MADEILPTMDTSLTPPPPPTEEKPSAAPLETMAGAPAPRYGSDNLAAPLVTAANMVLQAAIKTEADAGHLLSFSNNQSDEPFPNSVVPGAPAKIGRYEIIKLLGEGGFGSVYLAEQRIPVRRKVALKVVKLGMDTAEVLQRFEAERQALALMEHPNVARVYDAGVTDRGQPYFAMEFVEGVPLNNYVDDEQLSIDQRLTLFVDICRAVQHAHGKGLIHRDLKPGNIIVSTVDGKPAPKVIDFGIAKATGPSLTDTNFRTESGRLIGTPEYMSPEQCSGSVDIDTRTDVYALGVILYELLTGQLPFDSKMLRAGGLDGITKIIREMEPQRPSARVTSLDISKDAALLARISRSRRLDVRHLTRALKGDLDWIVLRALEKDRNRRYDTANALAMDVLRHMNNEPVSAGPPNLSYRLEKFARRNKVAFATLTAVAATLVLGVTFSTVGFVKASHERDVARKALHDKEVADEAQRIANSEQAKIAAGYQTDAQKYRQTAGFYENLFSSVDPRKARGHDVTVREVLDQAVVRADGSSGQRPEAEASLRNVFGSTFYKLGYTGQAESQLAKALELANRPLVKDNALIIEIKMELGLALRGNGKLDDAIRQLNETLALSTETYGERSIATAKVMMNLGLVYEDAKRYADAEKLLRKSLDIHRDKRDSNVGIVRTNLANLYHAMGDIRAGELLFRDALSEVERAKGKDDPATAAACRDLGELLYDRGEPQEAAAFLERAVVIWKKVLPPSHPDYREVLDLLGDAATQVGQLDQAESVVRESLAIREKFVGRDSVEAMESLANLANIAQRRGENGRALEISNDIQARAAETLTNEADPKQAGLTASYAALQGTLLLDLGKADEAEPFIRRALALREKLYGIGDWRRANTLSLMGAVLAAQGKNGEAEPRLVEAYDTMQQDVKTPAVTLERAKGRLYAFYTATKKPDRAAKYK